MFSNNQNKCKMFTLRELQDMPEYTSHVNYKTIADRMRPLICKGDIQDRRGEGLTEEERELNYRKSIHYVEYNLCVPEGGQHG